MLKEASVAARVGGIDNASWVLSTAEDFVDAPRSYTLITIASAFHWMDSQLIAEKAYDLLEPNGLLALIGNPTLLREIRERRGVAAAIADIQDRWFGTEQGLGPVYPEVRPEEVIRSSSFGHADIENIPIQQHWNVVNRPGFPRDSTVCEGAACHAAV
jgi:hypothetical protein